MESREEVVNAGGTVGEHCCRRASDADQGLIALNCIHGYLAKATPPYIIIGWTPSVVLELHIQNEPTMLHPRHFWSVIMTMTTAAQQRSGRLCMSNAHGLGNCDDPPPN